MHIAKKNVVVVFSFVSSISKSTGPLNQFLLQTQNLTRRISRKQQKKNGKILYNEIDSMDSSLR